MSPPLSWSSAREKAVGVKGHVKGRLFFHCSEAQWCWTDAKIQLSLWSSTHKLTTRPFSLCGGEATLEQIRFELCGSTYMWIFFSTVNTTVLHDQRLVESMNVEQGIQRNQGWGPTINYTQIFDCAEGRCSSPLCCSRVNCIYIHSPRPILF